MTAATATTPTLERRRERRVPVSLPVLVRGTSPGGEWFEERTATENLCRGGTAFVTRYATQLGMSVEITIPSSKSSSDPDGEFSTHGRVVHLGQGRTERERVAGVEFTGPRFNRIFVSEATS